MFTKPYKEGKKKRKETVSATARWLHFHLSCSGQAGRTSAYVNMLWKQAIACLVQGTTRYWKRHKREVWMLYSKQLRRRIQAYETGIPYTVRKRKKNQRSYPFRPSPDPSQSHPNPIQITNPKHSIPTQPNQSIPFYSIPVQSSPIQSDPIRLRMPCTPRVALLRQKWQQQRQAPMTK